MAIDMTKELVSVGVGVVDPALQGWDIKSGRSGMFKTATDIARLLGTGIGLAMQVWMPRQARIGEALALSCTPLLVNTVAGQAIRDAVSGAGATRFVPKSTVTSMPRSTVFVPPGTPSGYRPL
jgi:hypothetical protein